MAISPVPAPYTRKWTVADFVGDPVPEFSYLQVAAHNHHWRHKALEYPPFNCNYRFPYCIPGLFIHTRDPCILCDKRVPAIDVSKAAENSGPG